MTGRTDFVTDALWTDTILVWYCVIDDAYKKLESGLGTWRQLGPAPVFTDSDMITVALVIDAFFGGHEAGA